MIYIFIINYSPKSSVFIHYLTVICTAYNLILYFISKIKAFNYKLILCLDYLFIRVNDKFLLFIDNKLFNKLVSFIYNQINSLKIIF